MGVGGEVGGGGGVAINYVDELVAKQAHVQPSEAKETVSK